MDEMAFYWVLHSTLQRGDIVHSMDMRPGKVPGHLLTVCVVFTCLWGCSKRKEQISTVQSSSVQTLLPAAYTDTALEFPKLQFTNETVSLNDRCPVRKVKLNTRLAPLFVNGRPIGFC